MAGDPQQPTVWNWIFGAFGTLLTMLWAILGWNFREYAQRVEMVERDHQNLKDAHQQELVKLEARMAALISRTEFLSYMQISDEDRERRHQETLGRFTALIKEFHESREDIRAVNKRIDEALRK